MKDSKELYTRLSKDFESEKYYSFADCCEGVIQARKINGKRIYGHCLLRYSWKINCETTRSTGGDCEKGTPYKTIEEFTQWLSTESSPKEIAQYIADSLQKEFWRS